jgi:uncharacterized protein YraI
MLKPLAAIGLSAAALFVTAGGALADPGAATASVNVRTGPGVQYRVVDVLYPGEPVDIGDCELGWCHITHDGPSGWVSARYLTGADYGPVYEPAPVYEEPPVYITPPPIYIGPGPHYRYHNYPHRPHIPGPPHHNPPPNNNPPPVKPPHNWPNPPTSGNFPKFPHPGNFQPRPHNNNNNGGDFCQLHPTVCQNHQGQYQTP